MADTDKMQEGFRALLRTFRVTRSNVPITNRFPWQSRLAIQELLGLAADSASEVRILTGTGTDAAYGGETGSCLRSALSKGCKVRILVWNDHEHPYGATLKDLEASVPVPGKFELRVSGTREGAERTPHLLAVGDCAYRLEMPHPPYDNIEFTDILPETKAEICFNNPDLTHSINTYFDRKWKDIAASSSPDPAQV